MFLTGTPLINKHFNVIKNAMNAEAALASYDPAEGVTLQLHAWTTGVGAALLQNKKLIVLLSHCCDTLLTNRFLETLFKYARWMNFENASFVF